MAEHDQLRRLQEERDSLLRYALRHPPPNVKIRLPDGITSVEQLDLASCSNPLPTYSKAAASAAQRKGKANHEIIQLDLRSSLTYIGGSSGGVERTGSSIQLSGSKSSRPPASTTNGSGPLRSDSGIPATVSSTAVNNKAAATSSSSSNDHRWEAKREPSTSPSKEANGPASSGATARPAAGAARPEESKGLLGHLVDALRGRLDADSATASSASPSPSPPAVAPASATAVPEAATPSSAHRGVLPKASVGRSVAASMLSMWDAASYLHDPSGSKRKNDLCCSGANDSKSSTRGKGDTGSVGSQRRRLLPLCGTTSGTFADFVRVMLEGQAGVSQLGGEGAGQSTVELATPAFPSPPVIQLCEVFSTSLLSPFLDALLLLTYEQLLMASDLLLTERQGDYSRELKKVYRPVFNITAEQHRACFINITPPALRAATQSKQRGLSETQRRQLAALAPNAATLMLLRDNSTDDEFLTRVDMLLSFIQTHPDAPGDSNVPFALRAMIYAASLIPLYRLNMSTLLPIYTEKDIHCCVSTLRQKLNIPCGVERYCHLHARLLANDQDMGKEGQAVFLKDVARAVSRLGASSISDAALTPPVKYAYYVLQETFCLAAVPMPWLDSTVSFDTQRSVSAVFIETCLALPPSMLSALVLVNNAPVLPPYPPASSEVQLLALMSVFVNSGVLRNFADRPCDSTQRGGHSVTALLGQLYTGLDEKQQQYCRMLTRIFSPAMMLIVPGRLRIGAYVILVKHWGGAYPNDAKSVPPDLKESLMAFLDYLWNGCHAERRGGQSNGLQGILARATTQHLRPFTRLIETEESVFGRIVLKKVEELSPHWATTFHESGEPPSCIGLFFHDVFSEPHLPLLCHDAALLQSMRLSFHLTCLKKILALCTADLAPPTPAQPDAKVPFIAFEYVRLQGVAKWMQQKPSFLTAAMHRLNTVVAAQESFTQWLQRTVQQYDVVQHVTGASDVPMKELMDEVAQNLSAAEMQICDIISLYVLYSLPLQELLQKFMQADMSQYKTHKRSSSSKNAEHPLPRRYPEVDMHCLLEEIRRLCDEVCDHAVYQRIAQQIQCCVGHNFVVLLFHIYIRGDGVFLTPADAAAILQDLDDVQSFFFEVQSSHLPSFTSDQSAAFQHSASTIFSTPGADLLRTLRSVVEYVMTKPSAELISGGVGVPPLHTLPESSDNSPWSQFVVRSVLDHRKVTKAAALWRGYKSRLGAR